MAISRSHFHNMGGFWEEAGNYCFMDLCLRAGQTGVKNYCMYLPKVCLAALKYDKKTAPDAAIHFFGKWQGRLWENQTLFYGNDQITQTEIDTARLTQSMAATP